MVMSASRSMGTSPDLPRRCGPAWGRPALGPPAPTGQSELHALEIECGLVALAEDLQGALLADGVGALEDPVLPGGQAAEDAGDHVFGAVEAQVGLHAGQRI